MKIFLNIIFLFVLVVTYSSCSSKAKISHNELVELLQIRKWILPLPTDENYEWAFDIYDYEEVDKLKENKSFSSNSDQKAEIIFMPTGENSIYRFWFKQRNGTSSGFTRIDVCEDPKDIKKSCDFGQFSTTWYKEPLKINDKTYVIAELEETFMPFRKKQVVPELIKYRI